MITALIVSEMLCSCGKTLSELIGSMEDAFPCSGEINRKVTDSKAVLEKLKMKYKNGKADTLDGLSIEFPDWRFNLRASNTEPVIRLNVETRGNRTLLEEKTQELLHYKSRNSGSRIRHPLFAGYESNAEGNASYCGQTYDPIHR